MWLYDPRRNTLKSMTVYEISDLCGSHFSYISKLAKCGNKIKKINCYVFKNKPTLTERKRLYEAEDFQGEVWRPYKNTNYQVSNFGRVKKAYKSTTAFILPYLKRKYMTVKIKIGDTQAKEYRLRDIVAEVFLKPIPGATCIIHKNGDYTDCSVWNIERANRTEVAKKTGGKSKSKAVVLVDEETMEIIDWWSSARKAALANFMSYQAVSDRCNGKVQSRKEGYFMWETDHEEFTEGWSVNYLM